jgi:hypothetical protein
MTDSTSGQNNPPDLPWDKEPTTGWRETVDHWTWRSLGSGEWQKSGPCPRCKHEITVDRHHGGTLRVNQDRAEEAELESIVIAEGGSDQRHGRFARCNCGEHHPGRPAQITHGCGQWAYVNPPPADE